MTKSNRGILSVILVLLMVLNVVTVNVYLPVTVQASEPDTSPPTPPRDLHGEEIGYDFIKIAWDEASDDSGTVSYVVYRDESQITTTNLLNFLDNNLTQSTSYEYGVKSIDPAGNTSDTVSITLSTLSLETPQNINTTATDTTITITWDSVARATGYDIQVDGEILDCELSTSYEHTGLDPGTEHTYRVRTKDGSYMSDWSASVSETTTGGMTLPVPSSINTTATENSITLTWNAVADATGYDVEADGIVIDNGTGTSFEHTGLMPGT